MMIVHFRIERAVRHLDEDAGLADGGFRIEAEVVVADAGLRLAGAIAADLGPEELAAIGEAVAADVIPADPGLGHGAGGIDEERRFGHANPVRFIARVRTADTVIETAEHTA